MPVSNKKREYDRQYSSRWRKKNPNYHKNYIKEWREKNPTYYRQYNLLRLYGLTEDEYQNMAAEQEHCCKICQRPAQLERHGKLHVDHLKGTKVVRGLLCCACNTAIGLFKEKPMVLAAAIEYLRATTL